MITKLTIVGFGLVLAGAAADQRGVSQTGRRDLVGRQVNAVVTRVADADTLEATVAGESHPIRIRLEGIDAPEQGEVFSREAAAFLRTLVFDQRVRVLGRELDRYGRLVARVRKGDNDVSVRLVRAGLACHAYAYDAALAREEAQARAARAGFWGAAAKPGCVTSTAFSRLDRNPRAQPEAATIFHGNTTSRIYHAPHCPNYNCRNCTQVFRSHADAQVAGFRPARDCLK